jgi:hypothetical protein
MLRSSSDILARLPEADRMAAAKRMARIERMLARQSKQVTDTAADLISILKSPLPQAQRLRELIKEIANERN